MERPPAAANRLVRALVLWTLLFSLPVCALAERSITNWFYTLWHYWDTPAPEESALAPQIAPMPPLPDLLRGLRSRSPEKRLAAINALGQTRDASPAVISGLVRATQDSHPDISKRALLNLSTLCRAGHTDAVLKGFSRELAMRPEPRTILFPSDYHFKILDPNEDARAQAAFKNAR